MHYPPTNEVLKENSEFMKIMAKYNVKRCVYGHLHGESHKEAIQGEFKENLVQLVSCDFTGFNPLKLY